MVDVETDPRSGTVDMSGTPLFAAILCALAAYALLDPGADRGRLIRVAERSRLPGHPLLATRDTDPSSSLRPRLACAGAGIAAVFVVGGPMGFALGLALTVVGPIVLGRMEPKSKRVRRQELESLAPVVADLLASCLASGASSTAATIAVAEALPEPVAGILSSCVAQMRLGASPEQVWASLQSEPALSPIARAVLRSADSGAPLADVLVRVADDLRSQRRSRLEALAQSVGVKAVAPLAVCFLPAFMLLGIVPLVASLLGKVLPS